MKKYLFLASVAALSFTACTNETEEYVGTGSANQAKEIAFFAVNQNATRTSATNHLAIEGEEFPKAIDMMVTAYEATAGQNRDFFGATNFKHKYAGHTPDAGTLGWWGAETTPRYWPLSPCYINFLAIANANDDNATSVTWGDAGATFASKVAVAMADNYAYDTKQHDFLYAIGHGEVTQSGNTLTFPDKVDMTFKHAQAYLVFKVKAADAASCAIKIKNIEIYGARFAGTATINHTAYNATSGQGTTLYWNPTTQTDAYKSVLNDQTAKADEATSVPLTQSFVQMGKIIIVPNMSAVDTYADNGTTKIKISYYLDSKLYTYEYELDNDTYEAGKKYIYDITFKLHEIFIAPVVQDWIVDLNNNSITDDDVMIDIPAQSTKHETALTVTADDAGKYTVKVTDMGASKAYTVAVTDGDDIISVDPVAGSSDGSGVATLTFNVKKHATSGTHTATIVLTKTEDSSTTTITVNQTVE